MAELTATPEPVTHIKLGELVDLDRYPLNRPDTDAYRAAVAAARTGLTGVGCAVIRDLVRPEGVRRLDDEITTQKHTTHFSTQVINPYFHTSRDPDLPDRHPINTFIERSSGFIPGDSWRSGCATDVLFRSPAVTSFIADCLGIDALHCYADPLAGLTANILDPGQQFTWHFDTNEFAVTVLVREADAGGRFEYVPAIRSVDDEGFDEIQQVLEGGRSGVRELDLRPGDLQIFRGRHSLHRVTRVPETSGARHAAIFAYTLEADVVGRVELTQQLFGRVLPQHVAAEQTRVRSDALTD
jgi:hypothetical protein